MQSFSLGLRAVVLGGCLLTCVSGRGQTYDYFYDSTGAQLWVRPCTGVNHYYLMLTAFTKDDLYTKTEQQSPVHGADIHGMPKELYDTVRERAKAGRMLTTQFVESYFVGIPPPRVFLKIRHNIKDDGTG